MNPICIWDIQGVLKDMDSVSVPWVQSKYELSYQEAKLFLAQLIMRGWIEKEPDGIQYKVVKENLCLRNIERSEVPDLIEDMTPDCVSALNCVLKNHMTGADFADMSYAVRGDEDTRVAVEVLIAHKLIYCADGLYFICVSPETVRVLSEMVRVKRRQEASRRLSDEADEDENIYALMKLFDSLFSQSGKR